VDSTTLSALATSITKLGVPLMIYHGKRDEVRLRVCTRKEIEKYFPFFPFPLTISSLFFPTSKVVPLNNTLQLLAHVNRVNSESALGGGRGWCALRLVPNGGHDGAMWAAAYALDMSLYVWLLQHDLPSSHAHQSSRSIISGNGSSSRVIGGHSEDDLSGLPPGVQLLRMPAARLSTRHASARQPGPGLVADTEGSLDHLGERASFNSKQQRNGGAAAIGAVGGGGGGGGRGDRFQDKRVARPAACGSGDPSVVFPCMPQVHATMIAIVCRRSNILSGSCFLTSKDSSLLEACKGSFSNFFFGVGRVAISSLVDFFSTTFSHASMYPHAVESFYGAFLLHFFVCSRRATLTRGSAVKSLTLLPKTAIRLFHSLRAGVVVSVPAATGAELAGVGVSAAVGAWIQRMDNDSLKSAHEIDL